MAKLDEPRNSERYHKLQERYGAGLPARMTDIEDLWQRIMMSSEYAELTNQLRRQIHTIAGSAGTLGFSRISKLAHQLDTLLYRSLNNGSDLKAESESISQLLNNMRLLADSGPDMIKTRQEDVVASAATPPTGGLVYLIEDDALQAEEISTQLRVFGWDVVCFGSTTLAQVALTRQIPAAIIVDIGMPEGELAGAHMLRDFAAINQGLTLPKIFISLRWDWQARLAAAQAGADAYFRKPLNISDISVALTELTKLDKSEPFRILIVDDVEVLAEHYATVLQGAGMQTMVVTEAAQLLAAVDHFAPELVLLDLYMPGCSGVEVARVLRQDPDLIGLPIVFLSTETELDRQLSAMQTGADDFIEKPIEDSNLVSIISTRATRFRTLSSLMHLDSMTRLHNHSAIKLKLDVELGLSTRTKRPLSFVMIDIDHFKLVNDTHGHLAGDRVIRALALMLGQRLRKSDFVGRYGGEEFAIIMPDTTLLQAEEVVNELREQFSMIKFPALANFSCTFSAGISDASIPTTRDEMIACADEALYSSKENGRNRVSVAIAQAGERKTAASVANWRNN